MNLLSILAGLAVLALSAFIGYLGVVLLMEGGTTPIFGGIALTIVALMTVVVGVMLIALGWAGFVARIRSGK